MKRRVGRIGEELTITTKVDTLTMDALLEEEEDRTRHGCW